MAKDLTLVSALKAIIRTHGSGINVQSFAQVRLGKSKNLTVSDALVLLREAHHPAYITSLNEAQKSSHPSLLLNAEQVLGILLPGQNKVSLPHQRKEIPLKDFLGLEKDISAALVVPPATPVQEDTLDWFWNPFRTMRGAHIELFITGLFINLFTLAIPLFTMSIYDRVLPTFATPTLWALTIGVCIVLMLDMIFRSFKATLLSQAHMRAGLPQDEQLLEHFLRQKNLPKGTGERLETFHLLSQARESLIMNIFPAIVDLPFIMLFVGIIYLLSPALALVPIGIVATTWLIQGFVVPKMNRLARENVKAQQNREALLHDLLAASISIRLTNSLGRSMVQWRNKAGSLLSSSQKSLFWQQIGQNIAMSMAQISSVIVLIVGVFEINAGTMSIGALIATSILSGRAIAPALHISDAFVRLQRVQAILAELKKVTEQPLESLLPSEQTPEQLTEASGALECRQLVCTYPSLPKSALEDVSFQIQAGERIGILGRNGAGKSTLAGALSGLIIPSSGQVLLDGIDIQRLPAPDLRQHVMFVQQSPYFPNIRIRDAIATDLVPDEERLQFSLRMSGLEQMMAQTGIGLETEIGENGQNLSGGQRQMLALAQAMYHQPKVLILDEPTSHFDHQLEHYVKERLFEWLEQSQSTFILITHRLGLLDLTNRLFVLNDGKLAADGPRDKILKQLQDKSE